jgi:hypothetical protein
LDAVHQLAEQRLDGAHAQHARHGERIRWHHGWRREREQGLQDLGSSKRTDACRRLRYTRALLPHARTRTHARRGRRRRKKCNPLTTRGVQHTFFQASDHTLRRSA